MDATLIYQYATREADQTVADTSSPHHAPPAARK